MISYASILQSTSIHTAIVLPTWLRTTYFWQLLPRLDDRLTVVDLQWYETIQEKDINNLWILKHLEILKQIEAIRNGTRHVSGLDSVDASVSFCAYVFRMALLWFIGATEQRWRLLLAKICWHTALRKLHNFFGHFFASFYPLPAWTI